MESVFRMDIMSQTSLYLEQGYQKVLAWCISEFRRLGSESHPEIKPNLRTTIQQLQRREETNVGKRD